MQRHVISNLEIITWVKWLNFYVAQRLFFVLMLLLKCALLGKNKLTDMISKSLDIVFVIMDPSKVIFSLRIDYFKDKFQKWTKLRFSLSQLFRKVLNYLDDDFHCFKCNFIRSFMTDLAGKKYLDDDFIAANCILHLTTRYLLLSEISNNRIAVYNAT